MPVLAKMQEISLYFGAIMNFVPTQVAKNSLLHVWKQGVLSSMRLFC